MASHGNKVYYHRIQMAMQPLRYAWLEVAKSLPFTDDWLFEKDEKGSYRVKEKARQYLRELCDTASIYGPILFHEISIKPQEYYERMSAYFENGVQMHFPVDFTTADKFAETAAVGTATVESGIPDDWMGLDCGQASIDVYNQPISRAKTIIWNG